MDEVVTEASAPNSSVRGHVFPALESGNTSFPDGRYVVGFEPGDDGNSFTVRHRIEGAALISDAIKGGLAQFVCMVASPVSSYRVSHVSESSTQVVSWASGDLGEPPMFTPMVVVTEPFERTLSRVRDGVHELWDGRSVAFERGMRLALSDVVLMRSSVLNMLLFERDPRLSDGEFRVEAEDREGFRFRVHLAPGLHRFLKYDSEDPRRGHIVTHILSACFGVLKADYSDDEEEDGGWRSYRGLQAMAEMLKEHDLPHWSEEEFSPELAATKLYPHRVGEVSADGDGEE